MSKYGTHMDIYTIDEWIKLISNILKNKKKHLLEITGII